MQRADVDQGDLSEAMQSANSWAAELRARAARTEATLTIIRLTDAADRIDAAVVRLRADSFASLQAERTAVSA